MRLKHPLPCGDGGAVLILVVVLKKLSCHMMPVIDINR